MCPLGPKKLARVTQAAECSCRGLRTIYLSAEAIGDGAVIGGARCVRNRKMRPHVGRRIRSKPEASEEDGWRRQMVKWKREVKLASDYKSRAYCYIANDKMSRFLIDARNEAPE
uniref:Transposase n=1 Tax=Steinernema glaseri TaxID=37863 RepID=A0A1I8ABD7_9BILA